MAAGLLATLAGPLVPAPPAAAEPAPVAAAPAQRAAYDAPLVLTMGDLSPAVLPSRGSIQVEGTISNRSVEEWTGLRLYPFLNDDTCTGCAEPITDAAGLAAAAETDPEELVGERAAADPAWGATIDSLGPGEQARFEITVPVSAFDLSTPGVYWFGVHALGSSGSTPDDDVADGRARTLIPYLPGERGEVGQESVETAIVAPVRHGVSHTPGGAVTRPAEWRQALTVHGRLGRMLAFAKSSLGLPVTWLVDPAVPDAVQRLVAGNPPRDTGPTPPPPGSDDGEGDNGGDGDDGDTDSGDPPSDGESSDAGGGEGDEGGETSAVTPAIDNGQAWLDQLRAQLATDEVLSLPYGDLDLAAVADATPTLYERAREHPSVLGAWGVQSAPTLASPGGYLAPDVFDAVDDASLALVTDRMFDTKSWPDGVPTAGQAGRHRLVVTSSGAASGGPGPDPRQGGVALRQRIISEAAVRLLARGDTPDPLVVVLPDSVDPSSARPFWTGFNDVPWLDLTTVSDVITAAPITVDPDDLVYPEEQEAFELDADVLGEASRLIRSGDSLQNLLTLNTSVAAEVSGQALSDISWFDRTSPDDSREGLEDARAWIEDLQGQVEISTPPGVRLSSADGSFSVTVSNNLTEPVTVQVATGSSSTVEIEPVEPIELPPESRVAVQLDVHTTDVGVHNVRIWLTDTNGRSLGAEDTLPLRSGQVGEIIWVIIGSGLAILFVAIAIRLVRRFRGRTTA